MVEPRNQKRLSLKSVFGLTIACSSQVLLLSIPHYIIHVFLGVGGGSSESKHTKLIPDRWDKALTVIVFLELFSCWIPVFPYHYINY